MSKANFHISTKNVKVVYEKENHYQAIKQFMYEIASSQISLNDVGLLAICTSEGMEDRAFRILPALFFAGIVRWQEYKDSTRQIANFSREELIETSKTDSWMVEYVTIVLDERDPEDD